MKKIIFTPLISLILILSGVGCSSDECCINNENTQELLISSVNPDTIEEQKYTTDEVELLARIVWSEAGSDWLTDEHQRAVASVIINRVNDDRFPNSIEDVVYQSGQYSCVYNGMINQTPNQRSYDNAKYVLENGVTIPSNVVWQSQSMQGRGLYKYIQGHYFCY